MKPLIVLITAFTVSVIGMMIFRHNPAVAQSARIAMSVMLLFTAFGHFMWTRGMAAMLPPYVPCRKWIVYGTGVLEIAAAIGLLIREYRVITGWWLIALFVMLLPANIYAAIKHLDYQKATFDGKGSGYLWFRVPLQLLFITWTYLSAIH